MIWQILKPNAKKDSDELCFSDFETAYKRMGDEFAQVIALEEVHEIFEHFQVKRKNSGQPPPSPQPEEPQPKQEKKESSNEGKEMANSKPEAVGTPSDRKTRVGKIKIGEFIRTVSQDSQ